MRLLDSDSRSGTKRSCHLPRGTLSSNEIAGLPRNLPGILRMIVSCAEEGLRCSGYGWIPTQDISVSFGRGKPLLLQMVGFKKIQVSADPSLLLQKIVELFRQGEGLNPLAILEDAVYSLVRLYAGHFDHCPYDLWGHRRLSEAACVGLYDTTWVGDREKRTAEAVASFFERNIVAASITMEEGRDFARGVFLEHLLNSHPNHILSSLFFKGQAIIFPQVWEAEVPDFSLFDHSVGDALLPSVLDIVFDVSTRSIQGKLRIRGKGKIPRSWEWADRVYDLSKVLGGYLHDQNDSGGRTEGQNPFGQQLPQQQPGSDAPSEGLDGSSPFENPFVGRGDATPPEGTGGQDRVQTNRPGGLPFPGNAPLRPPAYDNFEEIDRVYSERAESLVIRDGEEEGTDEVEEQLTVGNMDSESAPLPDVILGGDIDWFRTRLTQSSLDNPLGLQLFRRCEPLTIPMGGDEQTGVSVPNLLLLVDSSGSMDFRPHAPNPNQRGKYDIVLCACYGIFKFIDRQGLADKVHVNCINFSTTTQDSGWYPCSRFQPVKKVLATYQGQNTSLDPAAVRRAVSTSPGNFVCIAITDGVLQNTRAALAEMSGILEAGNDIVLLHVGPRNPFTAGVEKMGGQVHLLNQAADLVDLCLDLAENRFGKGRQQQIGTNTGTGG